MPRVSVIMSVYNGERYLREAVESILGQTFTNFEFIIIDDGSIDQTAMILQTIDDERIRVFRNQKNIGLASSLNRGLGLARGEYVARMDADDISLPERFEKQVEFLDNHPMACVVSGGYISVDESGNETMVVTFPTDNATLQARLLQHCCICHGSAMMRKECLETIGGYRPAFRVAEDHDLFLRLAEKFEVANLAEPLYKYRVITSSISVHRKYELDQFVELAKELAKERRETGQDWLSTAEPQETARRIAQRLPKNVIERLGALSYGYLFWAEAMHYRGLRWRALGLAAKAFVHNPFNRRLWTWGLSIVRRKVSRHVLSTERELATEDMR
jgi:glycosyltransferase involved in cell wall biosynthesis